MTIDDEDEPDNDTAQVTIDVQSAATIEAQDGDTITITALGNTLQLVVDGEGPVVSDVTPRSGTLQSSSSVNIGFTVTDSGSGLRTDAEDPGSEAVGVDGATAPTATDQ